MKSVRSLFEVQRGYIRDSIVYGEFADRVDPSETYLRGSIKGDRLWWALQIASLPAEYPQDNFSRMPPSCAPRLDLSIPSGETPLDWKNLEHTTFRIYFEDALAFPILPGIPSGAYIGEHYSCTKHILSFGTRNGNQFAMRWRAHARAEVTDPGRSFFIDADIPFQGVDVLIDKRERIMDVQKALSQWFDPGEFHSGVRTTWLMRFELKI